MSTYAIGDVQGCHAQLIQLLENIRFNPADDTLWFTGDLINRGPSSLDVLRYVKELGSRHKVVLGNHDLHLLAVGLTESPSRASDTFQDILNAPDREELLTWLQHLPLLYFDEETRHVITHAGLAPAWSLEKAQQLAKEVEAELQSKRVTSFLQNMYGNEPNLWQDQLKGYERLRCITNYFTRMRYCTSDGALDFVYKGPLAMMPDHLIPWFLFPDRQNAELNIVFGHWAALQGMTHLPNVHAIDTGCVWGHSLTALRIEDHQRFTLRCA